VVLRNARAERGPVGLLGIAAHDAVVSHQALELFAGVLGGFKRSSQHSHIGGCDEYWRTEIGTIWTSANAIAGAAASCGA
jgi:hypothetical protein